MTRHHFISGLPRSGSTLLSAILRQNPRMRAGMSSPVLGLCNGIIGALSAGSEFSSSVDQATRRRLVRAVIDAYYADAPADGVVIDTNRGWTARMPLLADLFPQAKVIACVRNPAWVVDSLERQYQADPYEFTRLYPAPGRSTVISRAAFAMQHDQIVGLPWTALREAFFGEHSQRLLLVDYDLLSRAPQKVMPLIYGFLDEPAFAHDFDNLQFEAPEFDQSLGTPNLHKVRPKVQAQERRTLLPPDLFDKYSKMSFWHDQRGSAANVIAPKSNEAAETRG